MKKFLALFDKVGGKEILRQYWQNHVLIFAMLQALLQGFSKKGLEILRHSVNHKILGKLRKKYRKSITGFQEQYTPAEMQRSNKVWVCWLQGMENAPALVVSTKDGLAPFAYGVAGARALRTASILGVIVHMTGGILGLAIMLILTVLGRMDLLTPLNMFLYQLVWLIPGFLVTQWTKMM